MWPASSNAGRWGRGGFGRAVQEGEKHGWDHGEQGKRPLSRSLPNPSVPNSADDTGPHNPQLGIVPPSWSQRLLPALRLRS